MAETLTIEFASDGTLPVTCPAASPLLGVRVGSHRTGTEVPGVLCRVVHETLDLDDDPTGVGVYCCHPDGGFHACPIWVEEKGVIEAGFRSLGDPDVAERHWHETYTEDMTGSRYGDLSFIDMLDEQAQAAAASMTDPDSDGFVRAEGG